jgi:rhamnogalacturonyl hydrolase YesR
MKRNFFIQIILFLIFKGLVAQNLTTPQELNTTTLKGGLPGYDRGADPHKFTVFMREGGWCWYQDPRAMIFNGKLFMGAVQGNGTGPALVGVYDLRANKNLGSVVVHDNFDNDDHNAPVFYSRSDSSVMCVYQKHNRENVIYSRISDPKNPLRWGDESVFDVGVKTTYSNLIAMSSEKKLYNFFRGINWNPTFITSSDEGKSWSEPFHFISSEVKGKQRPYARYAGNGKNSIFISFTDAHPRNYGNSLYFANFHDGKFWKANGSFIKDLAKDGPLRPSEAELIFKGSGELGTKPDLSVPNSAWTSSIVYDAKGYPHIGYTLYISNTDHRFRIASWNGSRWFDREVAFGGKCLYDLESSYTGLISIDPVDPTYVVISTDVDPTRGVALANHEIFRAKVGLTDSTSSIRWEAITINSPVRNIRPVILRDGNKRIVLWNRGVFKSFINYQMDIVGLLETTDIAKNVDYFSPNEIRKSMISAKEFQEREGKLTFDWLTGTFYTGVMACYKVTGDKSFLNASRDWCESGKWIIAEKAAQNADNICTAQTFLDVYFVDKKPKQIESINALFEKYYFNVDTITKERMHALWKEKSRPMTGSNLWWWCDALYMAPPVMARLGYATANPKYYEMLHKLYWETVGYLYNENEHLFFRDKRFFDLKTPKGKPVFWGRGNGWVIGGLVRTIDYIPKDDPMRPKYIKLFQDIMTRILTLQGEDGLWRSSLNEPEWFPMPETSSSSFFAFGIAAGINRGWLDRKTYLPIAKKTWNSLAGCLSPEGKVQWSQRVSDRPGVTVMEDSRSYTQGAFLLAASEMFKLANSEKKHRVKFSISKASRSKSSKNRKQNSISVK